MKYYLANDGMQIGPCEMDELLSKGLRAESLVWAEGISDWKQAIMVPEVAALLLANPQEAHLVEQTNPGTGFQASPSIPKAVPAIMNYQTPLTVRGNGMAIASMVLGILSYPLTLLQCAGIITALLAIVFGFVARGKVQRGETAIGKGMALAGIILGFGYFALVGSLVLILVYFF